MPRRIRQRAAAGVLGKYLTRRSHGRCELCAGKADLRPWEMPPFPEEPDPDNTMLACIRCREWLEKGRVDPLEARFLASAIWSEIPVIRGAARQLLLAVPDADPWVHDALEAVQWA